jgi:limonene-1,2-epoxide hydrolase
MLPCRSHRRLPDEEAMSPNPRQNEKRLRQLFVDLGRLDFDAVVEHCAEDCVYEDVPYPAATVTGREAIRAKLALGLGKLERIPTTIHELVAHGDTILVERTEVWHHKSGERATLPVAALFKFRDGEIVLWRDYWDAHTLLSQQPADWLPEIPRV